MESNGETAREDFLARGARANGNFALLGQSESEVRGPKQINRRIISALVVQTQLVRKTRSLLQESQTALQQLAVTRAEVRDLRQRLKKTRSDVVQAAMDHDTRSQSRFLTPSFTFAPSEMRKARDIKLLQCPECGLPPKLYQRLNGVDHASVFCGNTECRRPAIYYGTICDAAAKWNRYAAGQEGQKGINFVGK